MSAVVLWRCVDCAAIDEVVAPEPSQSLTAYIPPGWTATDPADADDRPHQLVRCPQCSAGEGEAAED
jgi:hypothetical protein